MRKAPTVLGKAGRIRITCENEILRGIDSDSHRAQSIGTDVGRGEKRASRRSKFEQEDTVAAGLIDRARSDGKRASGRRHVSISSSIDSDSPGVRSLDERRVCEGGAVEFSFRIYRIPCKAGEEDVRGTGSDGEVRL